MELYYFLPKALEYGISLASVVLLVLLWRTTRIAGFAGLAGLSLFGHLRALVLTPFLAKTFGAQMTVVYSTYISVVTGLLGAFCLWHVYSHLRQAQARAGA